MDIRIQLCVFFSLSIIVLYLIDELKFMRLKFDLGVIIFFSMHCMFIYSWHLFHDWKFSFGIKFCGSHSTIRQIEYDENHSIFKNISEKISISYAYAFQVTFSHNNYSHRIFGIAQKYNSWAYIKRNWEISNSNACVSCVCVFKCEYVSC